MPETIKASEQNLDKVFCDDYLFEIPFYQRPYAWTTDEVSELLEDLLFAMKRGDDVPYFLGSIVLVKGGGADSKVIDGQQRLTTLTILLCTLRDLADGDVRTALDARVRQRPDPLAGTREVMRLSLRPRDQDFFRANVQQDGAIPGMLETPPAGSHGQPAAHIRERPMPVRKALGARRRLPQGLVRVHHPALLPGHRLDEGYEFRIPDLFGHE